MFLLTLLWSFLSLHSFGSAAARAPDDVFVRHARALIPAFLDEVREAYGHAPAVDLATARVAKVRGRDVLHPLAQADAYGWLYFLPLRAPADCRRVDVDLAGGPGTARFFVRAENYRYRLTRTCQPADLRRPGLRLTGPSASPDLTERDIRPGLEPLLGAWVRDHFGGAEPDLRSVDLLPRVRPRAVLGSDEYANYGSDEACWGITVDVPAVGRQARVDLGVTIDPTGARAGVAPDHQVILSDPRRWRQVRYALLDRCGEGPRWWWARALLDQP